MESAKVKFERWLGWRRTIFICMYYLCSVHHNKKINMKLTKVTVVIAILLALCPIADASLGIGIAPVNFTLSDALRGGGYEQTITVFNAGNQSDTFLLSAEGECCDWISFCKEGGLTPITEILVPAEGRVSVTAMINIPSNAENRNYTATIYAQSIPKNVTGEGGAIMGALVRIPQSVIIQVTGTQILKGTVKSITTTDTEIGYPLKIKVEFQNEGNVISRPTISCCITKNNTLVNSTFVDTFVYAETDIKPGKTDTITVLWNTTVKEPGDYTVSVNVSLGEGTLATKDLPFKILPPGTLTRAGELKLLYIEGDPLVNHVIKVIASFENTGMIDTMAKFKGEIYCNGEFVDVLEGEEKLIAVGETANLISYYKMTMPGDYFIKGTVIYEGKETEAKEASFAVPEPRAGELKSLSIDGKPEVNRVIKVIACFENTGTVDTKAMFTGEVYCDGEFVDILEGEEKLIAVGETVNLGSYYKIAMPGDYLINGTVIYEGKETEAKEVSFTVTEPE